MAAHTPARKEKLHRRGLLLEWFTVAWNVVEAVVAIGVGLVYFSAYLQGFKEWRDPDSNRGHHDFQSFAEAFRYAVNPHR